MLSVPDWVNQNHGKTTEYQMGYEKGWEECESHIGGCSTLFCGTIAVSMVVIAVIQLINMGVL